MNAAPEILQKKFSDLLNWEKRKRREQILLTVVFYAVAAALLLLPLYTLLPAGYLRWLVPLPFFLLLAPLALVKQRWRRHDSTRLLAGVDKALRLEERAVTAWELIEKNVTRASALLVLKEAADGLKSADPRALLRRQWDWRQYAAIPLLFLWLSLVWFEIDLWFSLDAQPVTAQTLAQKLREFSRDLQRKAGNEGLEQSLQAGRELEKAAQKSIEAKTADEQFKRELSAMSTKVEGMRKAAGKEPSFASAESRDSLKDLKGELEAAQELLNFPEGVKGQRAPGQQWLDRLASLPQLKRQFDQQDQANRSLTQGELKSLLGAMEKQVTRELDRRTLLDAQRFLEQLARQGQGEKAETNARVAGRGEQDLPGDDEKAKSNGSRPGTEPGTKEESFQPPPQFPAGAPTQLKGMLGEGNTRGMVLKGKPSGGKAEVSQDEVIANYRRQAEEELNTERVPEALKETIRKYFMALEAREGQ